MNLSREGRLVSGITLLVVPTFMYGIGLLKMCVQQNPLREP